jgi:5-methylcytosine-specific restriction endonuclease McrA
MDFGEFRALFWSQIAMLIRRRDSFKCQFESCEETDLLEIHHIIPRRAGGSDHPANLITYCQKHHVAQGTHGNGSVRGLADRKLDEFGGA